MFSKQISGSILIASLLGATNAQALNAVITDPNKSIENATKVLNSINLELETNTSLSAKFIIMKHLLNKAKLNGSMKEGPDTEDFSTARLSGSK